MTHLGQIMLEELERRNYAPGTIHSYIRTVEHFAQHFRCSPDKLGLDHIRQYQAAMFHTWKLAPNTVAQRLAALRFLYIQVLKQGWSAAQTPYPKKVLHLPQILSQQEVAWINGQHEKVLTAITRCRTAALGGHRDQCSGCGHTAISYNSCRNRHCPKCQGNARLRWLEQRERELLPTRYVHAVFTLPRELAPLALQNKRLIYGLLFRASAATLLEVARDPRHLGAEIGFFSVLHTWDQRLQHHPHVHCVIAAGGLAPDHSAWRCSRRTFFLPVKVLGRVFRGKFLAGLKAAFRGGKLEFHGHLAPLAEPHRFAAWLRLLYRHDWVVYAKPPFGGPEHALRYLGAYTHRVGIANSRLVSLSDGKVSFRWRDSAHGNRKRIMSLPVDEFLRRFLLHLLPRGFVRIRNFGFLANRQRAKLLPLCFRLLQSTHSPQEPTAQPPRAPILQKCPRCGGSMQLVERLTHAQLMLRSPPARERSLA